MKPEKYFTPLNAVGLTTTDVYIIIKSVQTIGSPDQSVYCYKSSMR